MVLLDTFDLQQHVKVPTHCSGHLLDLVITKRLNSATIISTSVFSDTPSDQSYVICDVYFPAPKRSKVLVKFRKLKGINIERFMI